MSAVWLYCPHCGGQIQIDASLSGRQAACPLCGGVMAIPELPPSFGPPGASPPSLPPAPSNTPGEVDDLLPPTAQVETPPLPAPAEEQAPPLQTPPLPAPPDKRPAPARRARKPAEEPVKIPTPDGGYVAWSEPAKTVAVGGRRIELRRLSPEEKRRRRFRRNAFLAGFGLLFLIAFLLAMGYLHG